MTFDFSGNSSRAPRASRAVRVLGVLALCWTLGVTLRATTGSAQAQAGASGVPDLSDFAGAIAHSAEAPPPPATKKGVTAHTLFKTTLTVPSVKPGATARDIGRQLRLQVEAQAGPQPALAKLEAALPQVLTALEGEFVKNGFAKRDLGVAYGYAFIDLYENATGYSVPVAPSRVAMRTLGTALAKQWGAKFTPLPPATKEKIYESLIITTTLNTLMTQQFAKAGKRTEAANLRATSAALFEKIVGVPPAQVKFASNGRLSGLSAKPQDNQDSAQDSASPSSHG